MQLTTAYRHLGKQISYRKAAGLQDHLVKLKLESRASVGDSARSGTLKEDLILLLEHSPTYTVGRFLRNSSDNEEAARLRALGAEYVEVNI